MKIEPLCFSRLWCINTMFPKELLSFRAHTCKLAKGSNVLRHLLLGGGCFDQLINYCYSKQYDHRTYFSQLSSSTAAFWLTLLQILKYWRASRPHTPQSARPWLKADKFAKNTFTSIDVADWHKTRFNRFAAQLKRVVLTKKRWSPEILLDIIDAPS